MTPEQIKKTLAVWIGEILDTEPPVLEDDTHLVDALDLDSLALAELAAKLRTTYHITLRPKELAHDLRVGPIVALVAERLGQRT